MIQGAVQIAGELEIVDSTRPPEKNIRPSDQPLIAIDLLYFYIGTEVPRQTQECSAAQAPGRQGGRSLK